MGTDTPSRLEPDPVDHGCKAGAMGLSDDVRCACARIAAKAGSVGIDLDRLDDIEPGLSPALDPERHYLDGPAEQVAEFTLTLDAINFGSGWFPTLRKRPGCSGYSTIAWALADHARAHGPWSPEALRAVDHAGVAAVLGQDSDHELMGLYARALRELGTFLGDRTALDAIGAAGGSAQALAAQLAAGMPMFYDPGFYKRAQIVPADLALAGVADFDDLDELTIFADNLLPHVLRVDGVLTYDRALAVRIDAGELLAPGREEREIRACAVHACELIAAGMSVPPRVLDNWLWNRGQEPRYKARPRHRTRTTAY